jgi:putative peptide maturation system protein
VIDHPFPDAALVHRALAFLHDLAIERAQPTEALRRFDEFRSFVVTEARLDLVWDVEPYDAGVHYDLLVRSPDGTTTSLSVTVASDGLPWPLRGAQRVGDTVLLDVDGERLDLADAVSCLDAIADDVDIVDRLVDTGILRRELSARPVAVSDAEVCAVMDAMRRAKGLCRAADTLRWMHARGISPSEFQERAAGVARLHAVRRRIEQEAGGRDGAFAAWLDERRANAVITWFWARPAQTAKTAPTATP